MPQKRPRKLPRRFLQKGDVVRATGYAKTSEIEGEIGTICAVKRCNTHPQECSANRRALRDADYKCPGLLTIQFNTFTHTKSCGGYTYRFVYEWVKRPSDLPIVGRPVGLSKIHTRWGNKR